MNSDGTILGTIHSEPYRRHALLVINALNSGSAGTGEGEGQALAADELLFGAARQRLVEQWQESETLIAA